MPDLHFEIFPPAQEELGAASRRWFEQLSGAWQEILTTAVREIM